MLAFRPGLRRRSPHPYPVKISGYGLLTGRGRGEDGKPLPEIVISETEDLNQVAPTVYGYGSQSPDDRTHLYGRFRKGLGLKIQRTDNDEQYDYALNVDTSSEYWIKGPDVTTYIPGTTDATNGVVKGFTLGGVEYALVGRYVLVRASDVSWTVSKDFGAGNAGVDVAVFADNGTGTARAHVAMGTTANDWYLEGGVWTQYATFRSLAYTAVGRELYRASDTNLVSKVNTNASPIVEANWGASNQFRAGDKGSAVTRMAQTATGVLVIVKTDGYYSLDGGGQDIRYFPFLSPAPSADNGKGLGAFLNELYIPFGQVLHRLLPDFSLDPKADPGNPDLRPGYSLGRVTAFAGHDTVHAYGGTWDGTNGYLLKMLPDGTWHGSITAAFAGKRITALWKSTVGVSAGRTRMNIGFSDGTLGWFTLPNTADPSDDAGYLFSTADGELRVPLFTGGFIVDPKALYSVVVDGPLLTSSNYLQVEYAADPQAAYTALGTDFDSTRESADFPNNTSGVLVAFRFILKSTSSSATPQVAAVGIHHAWRGEPRDVYSFFVLAEDGLQRPDGGRYPIGRTKIMSLLDTARSTPGSVTMVLPDHQSKQATITRLNKNVRAYDDLGRQWVAAVSVRAVEFKANNQYGTHARLMSMGSHAALESYSHGQLETY